jgi:hypothetical protein
MAHHARKSKLRLWKSMFKFIDVLVLKVDVRTNETLSSVAYLCFFSKESY